MKKINYIERYLNLKLYENVIGTGNRYIHLFSSILFFYDACCTQNFYVKRPFLCS